MSNLEAVSSDNEFFMRKAIEQAKLAAKIGEVPVGAVVVKDGEIVSAAYNLKESAKSAVSHAELCAVARACERLGGWRLHQCDLYVTLEPCPMCAGAIINARIKNLYFGAYDKKAGCAGSVVDLFSLGFNHKPQVEGGILQEECAALLSNFFAGLRR